MSQCKKSKNSRIGTAERSSSIGRGALDPYRLQGVEQHRHDTSEPDPGRRPETTREILVFRARGNDRAEQIAGGRQCFHGNRPRRYDKQEDGHLGTIFARDKQPRFHPASGERGKRGYFLVPSQLQSQHRDGEELRGQDLVAREESCGEEAGSKDEGGLREERRVRLGGGSEASDEQG